MRIHKKGILFSVLVLLFALVFLRMGTMLAQKADETSGQMRTEMAEPSEAKGDNDRQDRERSLTQVTGPGIALTFVGYKEGTATISWLDSYDEDTSAYVVYRRQLSDDENEDWTALARIESDHQSSGEPIYYNDAFPTQRKAQVLYRVESIVSDSGKYASITSNTVMASNVVVCIDPGHYKNASVLRGEDLYGYNEGDFVLKLGLQLKDSLKRNYGISSVMTRTGDDIALSGFINADLDQNHLSLRGEYAAGCDLFISLHTNANLDYANDYPTCNQPIGITKTLVFLNLVGTKTPTCIVQANAIGANLSRINHSIGIASVSDFIPTDGAVFHDWSDAYNDALDTAGAVCVRWNDSGGDYYGVLRGASAVGVPGMIVEHAHHTVAETRQYAMTGPLAELWADADAKGIAAAYDFVRAAS